VSENTVTLGKKQEKIEKLTSEKAVLEIKIQKSGKIIIIISGILALFVVGIVVYAYLKVKGLFGIFKPG